MSRKQETVKVLTANRLIDGEAVWFGSGRWLETLEGSAIAETEEAVRKLEGVAERDVAANIVVDVALIDVVRQGQELYPIRLRERIRAAGPSIRPDLGKQARSAIPVQAA